MNDKSKTIAVIILVALLAGGGAYSITKLNLTSPSSENSPVQDNTAEEDEKVVTSVEDVTKIDNQQIKNINGSEVELENGTKFKVSDPTKILCKMGDVISGYDEEKKSFVCTGENKETKQPETRYIYQPPIRDSILGDLLLYRFFTGNTFLNNNGYTSYRSNDNSIRTTTYRGNNGSEIKTSPISKPTITKPTSSSSKKSSSSSSSKSSGNSGHGGGFGSSTSSSS
ncbi:MAG: hypothetical protein H7196_04100 [candidate division SR1 bacterium]|nr:hypothetical protein [candidate division SR1 bacterium]